jgi:hypothetical protein
MLARAGAEKMIDAAKPSIRMLAAPRPRRTPAIIGTFLI